MTSRQLRALIAVLRAHRVPQPPMMAERRALFERFTSGLPIATNVAISSTTIGGVAAERTVPPDARDVAIVYLHGGSYQVGSLATHRALVARLALATRATVLSLDYRLAPEHPFPAAVEDVVAAVDALDRPFVAGDSAGGGLAIAASIALRDRGLPTPRGIIALSPWTDLASTSPSLHDRADVDPLLVPSENVDAARTYLDGADERHPLASPLYADLRGLPRTLVQVGSAEILHDDATRFCARARDAGVDVTLEVWPDMIHVWQMFPVLVEADAALEAISRFIDW